ncbi:type I secretion membrane fusion protein, HlyD family [Methylorubrum populi BJ001]|jgi:HlyD family secretion protein|uniref:Membrane fusion protein (MFP) family protein n=1 Tax=Methylorubrum populi (strain ATCC BAA-705 / NCIMB 13946 / BJ001) TaxID=441620 RepID=B1ZH51_METPB|nr:HlyD family type I secretion periplasmic adaptor subunit [Methylorubrum populi]ACB78456.1 type I secretion membrane fusion protein, HlyD family [Methylorubrum populi BJ001]OAH24689.1 hemolysin secretion protein D [Methylorubrum populi]PZP67205.1 MAG: HlyD family type I secretion periplasmic adaptor subunit [Methylorubrum populi]
MSTPSAPLPIPSPAASPTSRARGSEDSAVAPIAWQRYAIAGYALIVAAFGVAGAWAATVRLDRAVISTGVIVAESSRKVVQHFEGGMVQAVLVRDGQTVRAGDVLLRIDPVQSQASADLFRNQLDAALVLEARLRAEQAQSDDLQLPADLAARRDEPAVARMISDQAGQLVERRTTLKGQLALIEAKVTQLRTEISGLAVEKSSVEQQVGFIRQELEGLRSLHERNLIPLSRLLVMERERTRLEGVIGRSVAERAKAENAISEAGLQITQLKQKLQETVTGQLLETRQRIGELREKLVVAQDVFRRHEIRASHDGVIQALKVVAIGQVVRSGEPLMEIVPTADRLVVNVQFSPNDLEAVHAGMRAEIKFPTFQARRTPAVFGTLTVVSRDRLVDEGTKQAYFAGTVEIDEHHLPADVRHRLLAGLPAEVVVSAGERTALEYLFAPFFDAMGRAFHER